MAAVAAARDRLRTAVGQQRRFGAQVSWSFGSKLVAALLQLAVFTLLARGLSPTTFAFISSMYVVLQAVAAVNDFGLQRQIQLRRSRWPEDPELGSLFALRLRFTYASAALWFLVWAAMGAVTHRSLFWAMTPATLWLMAEQTTTVWNAVSIVDGKTQQLMPSYLYRRAPVVIALVLSLTLDWDLPWTWSIGLGLGSVLAYIRGARTQETWALRLWPGRGSAARRSALDLGFWWCQLGDQLRDLDVAALALVAAHTGGVYAFPARLIRPMNMVTQATGSVAFPILVRRKSVRPRELALGVLLAAAPVVLISLAVAAAAPLIPILIGPKYAGAVHPMQVLCVAAVLFSLSILLTVFLLARSDRAATYAGWTHLLVAFTQIGLVAAVGWRFGPTGAACGAALAQVVLFASLARRSSRQAQIEQLTGEGERSAPREERVAG